jgi:hypothetical protein
MVPISPEIYSGAAVVMDNRSLFDYIQKLEDRRAKRALAEQEAVDNYLEDVNKKLTPTGMRAQDVPNFLKMQNDFRQLSNQYKSTRDPLKRLELQKKGDEMFLYIQKSKQADELAKPTREALKNPENRKKLNTERMMQDLAIHDMPLDFQGVQALGIPARRDINPNASYYRETPFDFQKQFDEVAKGPGITISELEVIPGAKFNTIVKGFSKPTIGLIADNFVRGIDADEDKKSYYTIRAKNLPADTLAQYGLKIKSYFPEMQLDEDLSNDPLQVALAEAIIEGERRKSQDIEKTPKISVSTGEVAEKKPPRDLYKEIDRATSSPQRLRKDKGAPVNQFSGDAQKALIKLANDVTGSDEYNQEKIYVKKFSDGKNYIVDVETNKPLVPFTKEDINIGAQVDVKGKRGALTGEVPVPGPIPKKSPIYEIKGKRYTEQELLGMGYTRDQIAPYIKK